MKGKHRPITLLTNAGKFNLITALLLAIYSFPMYAESGNYGNIISKSESFALKVNGTVIDDQGEVVIGATIQLKGTSVGAVTDENGKFSIEVPNDKAVLIISFVGYEAQEIQVGNRTEINIKLMSNSTLEEVVVVGYSTQKK